YGIDFIISFEQIPSHSSKSWIIQKAMWIDKSQNTRTILLDEMLSKTNEFHIIIIYKFRILLFKFFFSSWLLLIILHQIHYPLTLISRLSTIWWITYYNHHWSIFLYFIGLIGFVR